MGILFGRDVLPTEKGNLFIILIARKGKIYEIFSVLSVDGA